QYLVANYHFLTPNEFQSFIKGNSTRSGINLLLTFDDGFRSSYTVAREILKELNIKAIFFIPTEFIGLKDDNERMNFIIQKIFDGNLGNPEISSDMRPMTWDDLKYLIKEGHAVGSHTRNHKRLSTLTSYCELYSEIIKSGDIIERRLRVPINFFSWPFGDVKSINNHAMNLIRERYELCFSGVRGANSVGTSPYLILRDAVSVDYPLEYLRFIIEGGLDILYRGKVRKLLCLERKEN
ncbi:MAG: polysaccharide deacetylase family protein, partial [Candidatus Baldrarchaeia archaeon]